MSAPNVALYAVTIMAQPSFEEENPDINHFQRLHRRFYLPTMTFLFGLCLLGAAASVFSLSVRWRDHRKLPFSHAHSAFCAPALSHANAIQAYRAAVLSFSGLPARSPLLAVLYAYWLSVLMSGTFVTVVIATKYLMSLPKWTHFDLVSAFRSLRRIRRTTIPLTSPNALLRKMRSSHPLHTIRRCHLQACCRKAIRFCNHLSLRQFSKRTKRVL